VLNPAARLSWRDFSDGGLNGTRPAARSARQTTRTDTRTETRTETNTVFSLRLAESALQGLGGLPEEAPAVAVIGPTRTGKSAVVNLLTGGRHVETSALAMRFSDPAECVRIGAKGY